MARARNIKPGFFRSADLVETTFSARLLFIGLWTIADRSGRLEDRPKQIKMEIFPADDVDIESCLRELEAISVIDRYAVDGRSFIQVVNFSKHQNPHRDERASTLPDKCGNIENPVQKPTKHGASTVQARCTKDADTVPIGLIPDSGFLIPETEPVGSVGASAPKPRASRKCPDSFALTPELISWAASEAPGVPIDTETAKLRDHTFKNAISDWPGAWRNWMRRAQQDLGFRRAPGGVTAISKHAGFAQKNYREGIEADGSIA